MHAITLTGTVQGQLQDYALDMASVGCNQEDSTTCMFLTTAKVGKNGRHTV